MIPKCSEKMTKIEGNDFARSSQRGMKDFFNFHHQNLPMLMVGISVHHALFGALRCQILLIVAENLRKRPFLLPEIPTFHGSANSKTIRPLIFSGLHGIVPACAGLAIVGFRPDGLRDWKGLPRDRKWLQQQE